MSFEKWAIVALAALLALREAWSAVKIRQLKNAALNAEMREIEERLKDAETKTKSASADYHDALRNYRPGGDGKPPEHL